MRSWTRVGRVVRNRAAVERELVPADAVSVGSPPGDVLRAGRAAVDGDLDPVRELLAATRRRGAWAARGIAVEHLATLAVSTPGWLEEWLTQAPDDQDALLVSAAYAIQQAWEVRSAAHAEHVAHDQFQAFHALLEDAHPRVVAAIEANPGDPVPWEWALVHARGLEQPPQVVRECLSSLMAADDGYLRGIHQALLYVAPRWFGSEDALLGLADQVVADADPASAAALVPLVAVVELHIEGASQTWREQPPRRVRASVDRAERWLESSGRGHPWESFARSALVYVLHLLERHDDAFVHLRELGERVDSYPWRYFEDEEGRFRSVRDGIVVLVAAQRR